LFCEESSGKLHKFSTLDAVSNICAIARDLEDTSLLAKIEGGDLIALESKYHLSCLVKLRNHHRSYLRESGGNSGELIKEAKMEVRAFAELLAHIETLVEEGTFVLKFSELRALYEKRLSFFDIRKEINKISYRFKEQILSHFLKHKHRAMGQMSSLFLIRECNRL